MYTPHVGRWLSEDPAGYVDGPNRYLYVNNSPITHADPSGRKKCKLPPDSLLDLMKEFLKLPKWEDADGRIALATVACVACQESDYDPCAKSKANAIGSMQLTKIAWEQCQKDSKKSGIPEGGKFTPDDKTCCKKDVNPVPECGPDCEKNAWNWRNNVRCGIYMLTYCRDKVKRKVPLEEILRCYNSGDYNANNPETNDYVKQIMECIPDMKKQLADNDKKGD